MQTRLEWKLPLGPKSTRQDCAAAPNCIQGVIQDEQTLTKSDRRELAPNPEREIEADELDIKPPARFGIRRHK